MARSNGASAALRARLLAISFFVGVILSVTNHLRHARIFVRALGQTVFHLDQKIRASRRHVMRTHVAFRAIRRYPAGILSVINLSTDIIKLVVVKLQLG